MQPAISIDTSVCRPESPPLLKVICEGPKLEEPTVMHVYSMGVFFY